MKNMTSLGFCHRDNRLLVLDQQLLPHREEWLPCESPGEMVGMIRSLKVRGAPLIGVAAALSLARFAEDGAKRAEVFAAAKKLRGARPTAVNLMWALDQMVSGDFTADELVRRAEGIFDEDVRLCESMAQNGMSLIQDGDGILTHCNTGGLATVGIGTALGVIRRAHEQGKKIHVYVDETRPLLQGARLTTWELGQVGIPYTLICDNMAAILMKEGRVRKCFVGADRIAANGDFANKVGTYGVAVLAHHHGIPFYVTAPYSTLDLSCPEGGQIPIEDRHPREVMGVSGPFGEVLWSPESRVFNPAFDVTPVKYVSGLVMDRGFYSGEQLRMNGLKEV